MSNTGGLDALLEALHQDVIQSFGRVRTVLDRADVLGISWSGDQAETRQAVDWLGEHAESVRKLELVMPIVAPMKAGKSTLVNAIVGYPLLPARANPMTTLPTRIRLVDGMDLDNPELFIPESTIVLIKQLNARIRKRMTESTWEVPGAHSHLKELAKSIKDGQAPPLRSTYLGGPAISEVLMRLNDQLRLGVLATGETLLSYIRELPEISTGYRGAHSAPVSTGGGQLVIVDTPGPNEYAMSAELGPALEAQVKKSHVVLVVLDYTQMGGDAAAKINDLLRPQLEVISTSKIFAVVNKVDERKKTEDLNVDQTRAAVRAALGLSEEQSLTQVFETVARWGLIGTQMLADIEKFGTALVPAASESATALLREVRPFDSEDVLAGIELDELKRVAAKVLDRSALTELLTSAIARLKAGAAPTAIESAIHRYQDALRKLSGILTLERNSAERGSEVVTRELATLDGDMQLLQRYRDDMPDARALEKRFRDDLAGFVRELERHGAAVIDMLEHPDDQPASGSGLTDAVLSVFRNTRRAVEGVLRGGQAQDVYEFTTRGEAEAFMAQMAGSITGELRELLDGARRQIDERALKLTAQVVAEHEQKVRVLIERATAKLSAAFDVELKVPPPAVEDGELSVELSGPSVRSWSEDETYYTTERRRAWYKLWIGYHDVTVANTRQVTRERFQVSRQDVVDQLRTGFAQHILLLSDGLDQYVATEVSDRLEAYYAGLTAYLESYHAALRRTQDGFQDDAARQAERKRDLGELNAQVADEQGKLADYLNRLADYVAGLGSVALAGASGRGGAAPGR